MGMVRPACISSAAVNDSYGDIWLGRINQRGLYAPIPNLSLIHIFMLFDGDDASMNFNFYNKAGAIQTKAYFFEAVDKTDSSVTMRLAAYSASYIDFIYTLKADSYLMNFEIKATGMENKLSLIHI